jgi:hypothetical protein
MEELMATRCPACNRVYRTKNPRKDETPDEAVKRIAVTVRAGISTNLRKPMPSKTAYKT